jgi:hypothetical protein
MKIKLYHFITDKIKTKYIAIRILKIMFNIFNK